MLENKDSSLKVYSLKEKDYIIPYNDENLKISPAFSKKGPTPEYEEDIK